jgi:hypothetical protein
MAKRKSARSHCQTNRIIFDNPFSPLIQDLQPVKESCTILAYSPENLERKGALWNYFYRFAVDLESV